METENNWLANYKAISFCGNTTDQYFAEEDEVVQRLYKIWNNSNFGIPNTDQFFADEDEVIVQPVDEVNLSKLTPETPPPKKQITTKIEEDRIFESGNSSPIGLQAHSCNSMSTDDSSSDEIGGIVFKYKVTSRSVRPDNESLISPGYPSSDSDNDSDYDSHYDSMKKNKKETKNNKKKSSTKSADYSNSKQNNKKNIPGLITQKVKTAIMANHPFYIRAREELNISEKVDKKLKPFAGKYDKTHKTWRSIKNNFLLIDPDLGKTYLEVINFYLTEKNREFYEEWLLYGKMNEKTKAILINEKQFFVDKFSVLLSGDDEEFDITPRKRIKTK